MCRPKENCSLTVIDWWWGFSNFLPVECVPLRHSLSHPILHKSSVIGNKNVDVKIRFVWNPHILSCTGNAFRAPPHTEHAGNILKCVLTPPLSFFLVKSVPGCCSNFSQHVDEVIRDFWHKAVCVLILISVDSLLLGLVRYSAHTAYFKVQAHKGSRYCYIAGSFLCR